MKKEIALDFARVTEAAALAAQKWVQGRLRLRRSHHLRRSRRRLHPRPGGDHVRRRDRADRGRQPHDPRRDPAHGRREPAQRHV